MYVFSQISQCWAAPAERKIRRIMDLAMQNGAPLSASTTAEVRVSGGVVSLGGYADIFHRTVQASGVVPRSAPSRPRAGGVVYSPA